LFDTLSLRKKSYPIDRLQCDLISFIDNLVVAYYFLGHPVYLTLSKLCVFSNLETSGGILVHTQFENKLSVPWGLINSRFTSERWRSVYLHAGWYQQMENWYHFTNDFV